MIIHSFLDEQLAMRHNWYAHKQKPKLDEMISTYMDEKIEIEVFSWMSDQS